MFWCLGLTVTPLVGGCASECEQACEATARRLDRCLDGWSSDWADLGAESRRDFADQCLEEWDAVSPSLESRELQQALERCEGVVTALPGLSCDELRAIYIE